MACSVPHARDPGQVRAGRAGWPTTSCPSCRESRWFCRRLHFACMVVGSAHDPPVYLVGNNSAALDCTKLHGAHISHLLSGTLWALRKWAHLFKITCKGNGMVVPICNAYCIGEFEAADIIITLWAGKPAVLFKNWINFICYCMSVAKRALERHIAVMSLTIDPKFWPLKWLKNLGVQSLLSDYLYSYNVSKRN